MPIFKVTFVPATFVQATFVQETFVLFRNISPVTDPILAKLFGANFCRQKCFWAQNLKKFGHKILLFPKNFWTKIFLKEVFLYLGTQNFLVKFFLDTTFFMTNNFLPYFLTYYFLISIFLTPNFFTYIFLDPTFFHPALFWGAQHVYYH